VRTYFAIVIVTILTILCCSTVIPGRGYKEIHYRNISPIDTEHYTLSFSEMHSQKDFIVMRMQIRNKSADYISFDRSKISYMVEAVSQNLPPRKYLIKPYGKKNFTLRSEIMPGLPAENASMKVDGLAIIPVKGNIPDLEPYPLPDTKKIMTADGLSIKLTRLLKKTKVTECTFEIKNIGEEPILYDHSRITVSAEGNENHWPTPGESEGYKVLRSGKDVDFHLSFSIPGKIVDMQFANMLVHWNESLLVSKEVEQEASDIKLEIDPGKTEGNN
jgi:hypothetical protein